MEKYCVYAHPSIPPSDIKLGIWYPLEELKQRFGLEYVTQFFAGANFGYEELEEIYPKKIEKLEVKNHKSIK